MLCPNEQWSTIRVDIELSSPFPSGPAEVEVRHQVQPKGVLRCQAHMRLASTMALGVLGALEGSNLVFPMPMMLVFAFIRYVKPF